MSHAIHLLLAQRCWELWTIQRQVCTADAAGRFEHTRSTATSGLGLPAAHDPRSLLQIEFQLVLQLPLDALEPSKCLPTWLMPIWELSRTSFWLARNVPIPIKAQRQRKTRPGL